MLHYEFKLEIFQRYLQTNADKCKDIAIETFENLLTLRSAYAQLYQQYQNTQATKKTAEVKLPSFLSQKLDKKIELTLHKQPSKYKISSIMQELEQLQVENQKLREVITQTGLMIIDFIPEMPAPMAEKFDALIDEMVER